VNVRDLAPRDLVALALDGDRRAVGRLLTLVERAGAESDLVAELTHPLSKRAPVIGMTGAPGSGKSTLVAKLVAAMVEARAQPAVLAVDPSSPLTGGAILGDRVRMAAIDDAAFIRSVATRGHRGGLALAIPGAVRVLDAAGYAPIVIETVGVGQVEVEIAATADTTVVVVTPGMGDAVQANKAGLLEVGDIFVVNKADHRGAGDTRRDLELMLDLSHVTGHQDASYRPPVVLTNALDGAGITEVMAAIEAHRRHLDRSGQRAIRRSLRARHEIATRVDARLRSRLGAVLDAPGQRQLIEDVAAGNVSTVQAAAQVTRLVLGAEGADRPC
jgi:LAO/AO transport system kinase